MCARRRGREKGKEEGGARGCRAACFLDVRLCDQSITAESGIVVTFAVSFFRLFLFISFPVSHGFEQAHPCLPKSQGETIKASLPRMDRKEMDTPTLEIIKT